MALQERILNASSNPGDTVLDPFCGCGTTLHAAQKLGRNWIGIDGNIFFGAKSEGRAIVSVKAGDNVGVAMIRDPRGVIEREGAGIGVFLTLAEPSRPMVTEAAGAGQYEMAGFGPVPRIQIVTVAQAMELRDRAVRLPARRDDGFKRAAREGNGGKQGALDL